MYNSKLDKNKGGYGLLQYYIKYWQHWTVCLV
jgi:hypothetical protein